MGTTTSKLALYKPSTNEVGWGPSVNASMDVLDNAAGCGVGATLAGTTTVTGLIDASNVAAGQLKFPAAQNASADANTLDDYEEGNWTPSVGGSATYTTQTGTYIKIGKLVTVWCRLQINAIGTGSTSVISGLPFTSANNDATGAVYFSTSAISAYYVLAAVNGATVVMNAQTALDGSCAVTGIFGAGTFVIFTLSYPSTT